MCRSLFKLSLLSEMVILLLGCSLFTEVPVTVRLPAGFPSQSPNAFPIESWVVEYPVHIRGDLPVYEEISIPADRSSQAGIRLPVARGVNLPVLARPVFSCGVHRGIIGNYPCGAVFPADINSGCLELEWADGFACCIIKSCLLNSDMIQGFDTEAFRSSLQEKAGALTDPDGEALPGGVWLLDPAPVISRLGYGLFRESSIRAAETMVFSIPASPGVFFPDNPFYPPVETSEEGFLIITVPAERRTVFANHDSGELIELYFSSKMWCWTNLTTGASESGRR